MNNANGSAMTLRTATLTGINGSATSPAISINGGSQHQPSHQSTNAHLDSPGSDISNRLTQATGAGIPLPISNVMIRNVFFGDLAAACNGFSADKLIGSGGFGDVYLGIWQNQASEIR